MAIHPTAIIGETAEIHPSTEIGPFVIIEDGTTIGKNNHIMAHAFIGSGTTIGDNNTIHMGAIVGHITQDKAFQGDKSYLHVGNNNTIREYATIHRGSLAESITKIGDGCLIMGGCHIAHDCILGNEVIMANMCGIAGYVQVEDRAIISGGAMVHQFVRIGRLAIISGNSRISVDVPPFMIAAERNKVWGTNVVGLKRAQFSPEKIKEIRQLYKKVFRSTSTRSKIINDLKQEAYSAANSEIEEFIEFVESSERGICTGHNRDSMT